MSFEWQDREVAARTLGVDVATLQAWIDAGKAPSRHHSGKLQVLIELLDEGETTAESNATPAGDNGSAAGASEHASTNHATKQGASDSSAEESVAPESAEPRRFQNATGSELELISKRELQLAGGMVAAWQRVAETAGQDLTRARRVGAVSWGIVAVLLVAGGIGLWASTRSITDVQGRLESTKTKLDEVVSTAVEGEKTLAALQEQLRRRGDDLADANIRLATAIERSDLTKAQADKLAAQHLLTKQIADRQAETAKALTDTLSATIEENKAKLATLEKELAAARLAAQAESAEVRKRETELAGKLASSEKLAETLTRQATEMTTQRDNLQKQTETLARQITEMTAQRDALQKQVEKLTTANADATKKIDDLQKQLQATKEQAGKSKSAVAEGTK